MKRILIHWMSLLICLALLNYSPVHSTVAAPQPVINPASGLPDAGIPSVYWNQPLITTAAPWVKFGGNPVLNVDAAGAWDAKEAALPSVLFRNGGYHMWYSGRTTANTSVRIGYATSPDGISWTKSQSNPVLSVGVGGAWDSGYVTAPHVIYYASMYKMWYRGTNDPNTSVGASIGYATSVDGVNWVKYASNPVLTVGASGAWDDQQIWSGTVIIDGSIYKMWYAASDGTNARIGYATSTDGVSWVKHAGNPVLNLGSPGTWDTATVYYPNVVFNGSEYEMWYTGHNGSVFAVGHATSPDGITWTKDPANPVLTKGAAGSWDNGYILGTSVIDQGNLDQMWYTGNDGTYSRIGYAFSGVPTDWVYLPTVQH